MCFRTMSTACTRLTSLDRLICLLPSFASGSNDAKRADAAIRFALLEVPFDPRHLVGDVGEAPDGLMSRSRKGIERGRFHLHGQQALRFHSLDGFRGFAERCV